MYDIICAGHICLDIIPVFPSGAAGGGALSALEQVFVPGKLTESKELILSTGGSVANTGISLIKLGVNTALMGKIGGDILGGIVRRILEENGGNGDCLSVSEKEATSYSVVIAPPGVDRIFIHNSAVNDTFSAEDIDFELVREARVFHLGYPTAMRRLSESNGLELARILKEAKRLGAATSIDTSYPDTDSENGRRDWQRVFENILPYTDIFMPSIEEALMMFDYGEFTRLKAMGGDLLDNFDIDYLPVLGEKLAGMGAGIVAIKCGALGYYARTGNKAVLERMGRGAPPDIEQWVNKEMFSGIYHVENVKSTTGAGDASIAGFLAALVTGRTAAEAINIACATGAACVTESSATGGISSLEDIIRKSNQWHKEMCWYRGKYFSHNVSCNLFTHDLGVLQ